MIRKLLLAFGLLWSAVASAQFTPGQVLTASELNSQFALYALRTGTTFTGLVSGTSASFSGLMSVTGLTATGTISLPTASLPLPYLATQAANTLVANATGSIASPIAISAPSCSTSSSALQWTSGAGLTCNTSINSSTLGGVAAASYLTSATASSTYATIPQATTTLAATGGSINGVSQGLTTPAASRVTTLVATSTITPATTSGIVGTTLADNANAGSVGEVISSTFSNVPLTSATNVNVTSISLPPGDWDVSGYFLYGAATATNTAFVVGGVNTVSATLPAVGQYYQLTATFPVNAAVTVTAPIQRINVSTTTTVFLVSFCGFSVSTATATGFLRARRVR